MTTHTLAAPDTCFQQDEDGNLPTCTNTGSGWEVSYPDAGDPGPGAGFGALFVLVFLAGVAFTIWKVSTARRMARDSGMDEGDATTMALFTDEGLESTYLASNLRGQMAPTPPAAAEPRSTEQRLRELESLRTQALITEEEYAERRRTILDGL